MLKEKTIDEFTAQLSSDSSSPGGGSVAALLGALSASLASMMANLTVNKKNYEDKWDDSKKLAERMNIRRNDFLSLIDKDASSFDAVIAAFKLPKETEEEKEFRTEKIQSGYLEAIKIPVEIAENSLKLFEDIEYIVKYGNKNVVTDGIAAAMCADCAIKTSLLNVKINLKSVKDNEYVEEMNGKLKQIEINSARKLAEIVAKGGL